MAGRIHSAPGVRREVIDGNWQLLGVPADSVLEPSALPNEGWLDASVPGTVAGSLRALGAFDVDRPRRLDAEDWWWRVEFERPRESEGAEVALCFDGLATLAELWLNDERLGSSENMFIAQRWSVTLRARNSLAIRFRSLDRALGTKRPRPRWRTPMVENQQLRWVRTTLLGHTPGWSPPAPPIGPYREIACEVRAGALVEDLSVRARLVGTSGLLEVACASTTDLELVLERAGAEWRSHFERHAETYRARLEIPEVERWWPHTHGVPALYRARLETPSRERIELGMVGFRELRIERDNGDFRVLVNGTPVFCRGACWTPLDAVTLTASPAELRSVLEAVVHAGMNMLRVGGTMVYESDDFYDLCDELGVLVWQDFMFANMDYPEEAAFTAGVVTECTELLGRLQGRPSLALLCGSSEGEQQAAMWGAARELWSPSLFHRVLPELVLRLAPDVPYWPSSAHGGDFPHAPASGTTSYYGVGAYLRPLDDARRSELRFASECLAFANVPHPDALPGGPAVKVHHPAWKARTPRDLGAGWDFDDVRDHYLELCFGLNARELRYVDHDRYLELGRVVTGEVMAATFAEWRRARSSCRGALIWFLKDLWPSAGWGVLDASGAPKAPYFYLRRVLQPIFLAFSDEGLNGLLLHLTNETESPLEAELCVRAFQQREHCAETFRQTLRLAPRESLELALMSLFPGFRDLTHAYRFGPASYDSFSAHLTAAAGNCLGAAFHLPFGLSAAREADLGLSARATRRPDGDFDVTLRARRFAQAVALNMPGASSDDDYFHLAPNVEHTVRLSPGSRRDAPRGSFQALNASAPVSIVFEP